MKKVAVFGSFVVDLMARSPHLPVPGETVKGSMFKMGPGGKGFNQCVAAHKAGADVVMMTKIGTDTFANVFDNSHIETEQYYMNILSEDLKPIVSDLRNIHMKDSNTASDIDYRSMVKNIID